MKDNNIITLFDENHLPVEMEVIATLQLKEKDYAILHAIANDEDEIFTVDSTGDQQAFSIVEDELERQEVIDAYYELIDSI